MGNVRDKIGFLILVGFVVYVLLFVVFEVQTPAPSKVYYEYAQSKYNLSKRKADIQLLSDRCASVPDIYSYYVKTIYFETNIDSLRYHDNIAVVEATQTIDGREPGRQGKVIAKFCVIKLTGKLRKKGWKWIVMDEKAVLEWKNPDIK